MAGTTETDFFETEKLKSYSPKFYNSQISAKVNFGGNQIRLIMMQLKWSSEKKEKGKKLTLPGTSSANSMNILAVFPIPYAWERPTQL